MLALVGVFIIMAARSESEMVKLQDSMHDVLARDAMMKRFTVVSAAARLGDVAKDLALTKQEDFPVVQGTAVVGMLSRSELLRAVADGDEHRQVVDLMTHEAPSIEWDEPLSNCFNRLHNSGHTIVPVLDAGRIVGILSLDNLMAWLRIRSCLAAGT